MFIQGDIVKSKLRTKNAPLFLMVIDESEKSEDQFNAVVLKDLSRNIRFCDCEKSERECFCDIERKSGYVSNAWNTSKFELTTFDDLKSFL